MEDIFKEVAGAVSLGCEFLAVLCVAIGAIKAAALCVGPLIKGSPGIAFKLPWVALAVWLMLALEFALAADIADTAVAPTWDDIGQLAAIAAIRTLLNFFLERDLDSMRETTAIEGVGASATEA